MCVCVCVCVCVRGRAIVCVCVCERAIVCVCVLLLLYRGGGGLADVMTRYFMVWCPRLDPVLSFCLAAVKR